MEKFVLKETQEAKDDKKLVMKKMILPTFRAFIYGVILTMGTYELFTYWGAVFPPVSWMTPIVVPLMYLQGVVATLTSTNYVFEEDCFLRKSNHNIKVKWKDVSSWSFEKDNGRLKLVFNKRNGKTTAIEFHSSYSVDQLKSLLKKYCKP